MPSLTIVTTSMSPAPVDSVGAPPGNLTAVELSVPKVAVLEPEPSCVIINVTEPPVGRLVMLNSVLLVRVTVCMLANAQLTVMVELEVSVLIFSMYPALNVNGLCATTLPVPLASSSRSSFDLFDVILLSVIVIASKTMSPVPPGCISMSALLSDVMVLPEKLMPPVSPASVS